MPGLRSHPGQSAQSLASPPRPSRPYRAEFSSRPSKHRAMLVAKVAEPELGRSGGLLQG